MELKRKNSDGHSAALRKKPRPSGATEEDNTHLGWASDTSEDYKTTYTDNGTLRADSEARRQWNYICTFDGCNQRFNRPCRLETHMRSHSKERPFVCTEPDCDKSFPRKDHLTRHVKNTHGDPAAARTFVCDWEGCGKSFTSSGRLQRHKDVHESKFYCTDHPPCNEVFRKEKTLLAHIKLKHLEIKPYPCTFVDPRTGDKCIHGYQTEGALQRHVYKIHEVGQGHVLFCMICAEPGPEPEMFQLDAGDTLDNLAPILSFATQEELTAHVNECHPPECSECGQRFKTNVTLKSHFETVHGDPSHQAQYPCPDPDCHSTFNRKHNLAVHVRTVHEHQARYICAASALQNSKHEDLKDWDGQNACGIAFKAKSSLDQHVRTHHLGLGNRKELRKAAKSKKKPEPSMLSMLTGVGYEKHREVPCLVDGCEYRFYMDRDLRRHLRAKHHISEDDVEEMLRERDALTGGQFWIGGLEDQTHMFDSVEPSMPQTPAGYFAEEGAPMPLMGPPVKPLFDQQFNHLSLHNEEMDMDLAMGLGDLAPATSVQDGLQWDMLVPVEQYNMDVEG
ncbi:hypothetical protein DE146DRAFT_676641 [Phaeosphaeria sp. MPI-PUGE-AT-0046c]|nr:hypothetical protein DE146DRAFT_676641 [Phaeosphaeria sp. MPI-PUGE-AT-0046c]